MNYNLAKGDKVMKQCIFCRKYKEDNEFNREHIILDSLGGSGCEDICVNVCILCNSSLGTRVDACLMNHEITKYIRYSLKIKGRNGVPNPFKKMKFNYADTPFVGELQTDKRGNISGFRADHGVYKLDGKTIIVGPRKNFDGYVNSQRKSKNLPLLSKEEIIKNTFHFRDSQIPHINIVEIPDEMKNEYIYFAFPTMLKMAYEFCFIKLGEEYLDDPLATEIRAFLMEFDYKKQRQYFCPTDTVYEWIDTKDNFISISLYTEDNKLYVKIELYGLIMYDICMSETASEYKTIEKSTLKIDINRIER